jgi:cysteine synthase B
MPTNVSAERKALIAAYGAEIVDSDALEGSDGAILMARDILAADRDAYFSPDQYNNPSNWRAHHDTTGPEIWAQTGGRVTHFVAGLGTSGTFTGTARRLHEYNAAIRCISVEPDGPWHGLEGMKHMATAIVPGIHDPSVADEHTAVATEDAYAVARELGRREGILAGHSAGAALVAVRDLARRIDGGVIVTILSDGGDRYLSTRLYGEREE